MSSLLQQTVRLQRSCPHLFHRYLYTLLLLPSEQAQSVLETDFSKPTVMLIGNEGNGLSQTAIDACDACVTIPMMGRAESLNAASSAAILMWEMMRGRIDMQLEESV